MAKLILAGGGNAEQSKLVDEFFVKFLPRKKFLFIPNAIAPRIWSFEKAYEWIKKPDSFQNVDIVMWEDLNDKTYEDLEEFDAIYLMGGNTYILLNELRKSNFLDILKKFLDSNKVVYGISAGAMIFGKDIEMSNIGPEAEQNEIGLEDTSGLNLFSDYNIYCHYSIQQDQELLNYQKVNKTPFVAITEKSGVYVNDNSLNSLGYEPVYVFKNKTKTQFNPNSNIKL